MRIRTFVAPSLGFWSVKRSIRGITLGIIPLSNLDNLLLEYKKVNPIITSN